MERHELPTHLHVDDKLIAGLTVRQVLFLSVGVSVGYSLWLHLTWLAQVSPLARFAVLAALVRLALAASPVIAMAICILIRPADRPLEDWLPVALRYVILPKAAVWQSVYPGRDEELVVDYLIPASHPVQIGNSASEDAAYWFDLREDGEDELGEGEVLGEVAALPRTFDVVHDPASISAVDTSSGFQRRGASSAASRMRVGRTGPEGNIHIDLRLTDGMSLRADGSAYSRLAGAHEAPSSGDRYALTGAMPAGTTANGGAQ